MKLPVSKALYYCLKIIGFSVSWEVSVGAVVFREIDGKREYLLLRYPSGHYDFPRGHKEAGESDLDTLKRETLEETGISDLSVFDYDIRLQFFYVAQGNEREKRRKQKRGLWVFKEVLLKPARTGERHVRLSHEHTDSLWLSYPEAVKKATFENAKNALRQAEEYLKEK